MLKGRRNSAGIRSRNAEFPPTLEEFREHLTASVFVEAIKEYSTEMLIRVDKQNYLRVALSCSIKGVANCTPPNVR